jgi:hypothetical protein
MKKLLPLLASLFLFGCNDNHTADGKKLDMVGVYRMKKQVANDGKKDTLLKHEQLKIYTDKYMMYASPRSTDSFGEYGIATYTISGDSVKENIFYTSSTGAVKDSALLKVNKSNDGYTQVIDYSDNNGKLILTEEYANAGQDVQSPLDGAWKQIRNIFINAKGDTIRDTVATQFKVYQKGHFIWANPSKDPASNNFIAAYGYGTFKVDSTNKIEETNINSTYKELVGRPVTVEYIKKGTDSYQQTIRQPSGDKGIEVYERLK